MPCRLYSVKDDKRPLAGLRVSVKDNFRVAGVKTTQSNRAFTKTYGPDSTTAKVVQELIHLGAVVVGKTKMSAFAGSEEATDQWIDFHAPFNPRGDGYQTPSGSTSGGGCSLATYKWLDFSIGTDSGSNWLKFQSVAQKLIVIATGSIRWPAAWNGLFGMRSSVGWASLEGVFASCR